MSQILITETQLEGLKQNLNEAYWLNTVLDVVGIVDPTGIADFTNAVSYYNQGDNLFAFFSLISAVPYVGDAVGKTLMGSMKASGKGLKYFQAAEKAMKAGNTDLAIKNLKLLEKAEGPAGVFAKNANKFVPYIDSFIDRIPNLGGLMSGFKSTMKNWVNLFRGVSSQSAGVRMLMRTKSPQEQLKLVQGLEAALKREKFLDPTILSKPNLLQRFLFGGGLGLGRFSDLFGKSSLRTRVLMGRTKFYLKFLDNMGYGNFVGPEELSNIMGESEMLAAMKKYESTPEGQAALDELRQKQTTPSVTDLVSGLSAISGSKISPITSVLTKFMSPI